MEEGNGDEPIPMVFLHPAMVGGGDSAMSATISEDSANGSSFLDVSLDMSLESSNNGAGDSFLSNIPASPILPRGCGKMMLRSFEDSGYVSPGFQRTSTPKPGRIGKRLDFAGAHLFQGESSHDSASSDDLDEHQANESSEPETLDQRGEQPHSSQSRGRGQAGDYKKQAPEGS